MTYDGGELDHSSETRITLWQDAMQVFDSNVIVGSGFNTYAYMHRVGNYEDTHNFFLKVLVETGVFGLALFLWLLAKTFRVGLAFSRKAKDPFYASLGLGLAGMVSGGFYCQSVRRPLELSSDLRLHVGYRRHGRSRDKGGAIRAPSESDAAENVQAPLPEDAVLA